jgi:hypothetical protein
MSDVEKVATNDTSDLEKVPHDSAEDFEGHRVATPAIEPKVEPDFEGHRMELKVEPRVTDRVSD